MEYLIITHNIYFLLVFLGGVHSAAPLIARKQRLHDPTDDARDSEME